LPATISGSPDVTLRTAPRASSAAWPIQLAEPALVRDGALPGGFGRWDANTGVVFIREYHPYRLADRRRNPAFGADDGRILDLKSNLDTGVEAAAREFARLLRPMVLLARTVLAVVPGHDERSTNRERALGRVVARLVSDIGSFHDLATSVVAGRGGGRSVVAPRDLPPVARSVESAEA
jgi:hypothetical protein